MGNRVLNVLATAVLLVAVTGQPGLAGTGRVVGKVSVTNLDGSSAAAVVIVYVVGFSEPGSRGATATIAQTGRRFVPDLVAITIGESVSFPNGDPVLHNVFSQSPSRKFDLGSFKRGETKDKAFPGPGVVDVYCNLHPAMAATILVLPNKRHTRAAPDGSFALENVPAGTWTVFAYTRRATKPSSTRVTVIANHDVEANLSLVRGNEPEHLNKYGEKYHADAPTYR